MHGIACHARRSVDINSLNQRDADVNDSASAKNNI